MKHSSYQITNVSPTVHSKAVSQLVMTAAYYISQLVSK